MNYIDYSTNKIKESGGRVTKTKLAVLNTLKDLGTALNPYEIATKIKGTGGKIDVVTVYRILEALEKLKLVHKSEKGFTRCMHYSCNNSEHCHHHFNCNKCQQIFEVHINDNDFIESIKKQFKNLSINSHDFRFSGICNKCKS